LAIASFGNIKVASADTLQTCVDLSAWPNIKSMHKLLIMPLAKKAGEEDGMLFSCKCLQNRLFFARLYSDLPSHMFGRFLVYSD